jgi:hypothetical protein
MEASLVADSQILDQAEGLSKFLWYRHVLAVAFCHVRSRYPNATNYLSGRSSHAYSRGFRHKIGCTGIRTVPLDSSDRVITNVSSPAIPAAPWIQSNPRTGRFQNLYAPRVMNNRIGTLRATTAPDQRRIFREHTFVLAADAFRTTEN